MRVKKQKGKTPCPFATIEIISINNFNKDGSIDVTMKGLCKFNKRDSKGNAESAHCVIVSSGDSDYDLFRKTYQCISYG